MTSVSLPPDLCRCGHTLREHHHAKSCTGYADAASLKFCKCEQFALARNSSKVFNSDEQGESNVMAKEKGRKLVLFEVTAKKAEELLDKKNATNAAIFYRVLAAAEKPMQRLAIYEASKSKCESAAAWERLGGQTHDTLARLRKAGFVKRIETREAVAETPKREKKAKADRPKRTKKSKPNGATRSDSSPDIRDSDIPQNEASAG